MGKSLTASETLSPRDKAICDGFLSGTSRPKLAEQHKLTRQRIGQILHHPDSVAYLLRQGVAAKALIYGRAGGEILERFDWATIKLADVIAIWKAAMPNEVAVTVTDKREQVASIAATLGLPEDVAAELAADADRLIEQRVSR